MFNSSLAQEMTAYIELKSAAFSDSLVSNGKRALGLLDQYLVQTGFQGKNLTEDVLSAWAKTLSGKSKARDISACMKILKEEYGGKIPEDFDSLLKLPGVGRKSANLIMGDVFGKPAIVTDTHCIRLCNRIGLVKDIKEPKKVEMALWKIVPPREGSDLCHRFVYHGRDVCTARTKPHCEKCCLADICKRNGI